MQVYLDVTRFLGDGRSKQEKLESLLSIPDRLSEEGKSEGFSLYYPNSLFLKVNCYCQRHQELAAKEGAAKAAK